MKKNMFPQNLPAFPGFISLIRTSAVTALEEGAAIQDLMTWNLLDLNYQHPDNEAFRNYRALMEAFVEYLSFSIPQRISKVEALRDQLTGLSKKKNYRHDWPKAVRLRLEIKSLERQVPDLMWDYAHEPEEKNGKYSWDGFPKNEFQEEDDLIRDILYWTLLAYADFYDINPRYSSRYLRNMPSKMNPWRPLFSRQRVTNEFMCRHVDLIPELAKGKEIIDILDPDTHNDEDRLSFFISEGRLCGVFGWITSFRDWGYTKEAAREFFGIDGFLSYLYNEIYVGIGDKDRFVTWIEKIILPEFDSVWDGI